MVPGQESPAATNGTQSSLRKASGLRHHVCPFRGRPAAAARFQAHRCSPWKAAVLLALLVKPLGWVQQRSDRMAQGALQEDKVRKFPSQDQARAVPRGRSQLPPAWRCRQCRESKPSVTEISNSKP